jgi:regulatory protein
VSVGIDEADAFTLAKPLAAGLRLGQSLSDEEIAALQRADAVETAVQRAMRLVAIRPRSERELRDYFGRAKTPADVQDGAVARLREMGAVDDRAFARAWVENRQAFRPRSGLALKMELRKKGVASETISDVLESVDEEAAAYQAGQKVSRRLHGLTHDEFRQRLGGLLARRGFDYSIIRPVVERLWAETSGDHVESECD